MFLSVGGSEGAVNITGGKGIGGGTVNHNSSLSKPKHINNVSVIQCGPALVNANQVKVKAEHGAPLILTPPTPDSAVVSPLPGLEKLVSDKQKPAGDKPVDTSKPEEVKKPIEKPDLTEKTVEQLPQEGNKTLQSQEGKYNPL